MSLDMTFDEDTDHDSTLGEEQEVESTESLSSAYLDYKFENGRRYHAFRAGQYFMPNDDLEQEAMHLMHYICQLILDGKLYDAPVVNPYSILDIGTGTGNWAIDVADQFPAAQVIATDLSPIQPNWIPTNLEFQVDDCESEWTFRQEFDFIHIRNLGGAIADWPSLLRRCCGQLRPGGWLECTSFTLGNYDHVTEPSARSLLRWQHHLESACRMMGREIDVSTKMQEFFRDAGFAQVTDHRYEISMPSTSLDAQLAPLFRHMALIEVEGVSLRLFTQVLGWSVDETQALVTDVRGEVSNPNLPMSTRMHFVVGQKSDV